MRFIHCADLHLDSKLNANLDKDKAKIRKRELLDTFSGMVDYAAKNGVDAILICGDLFDTGKVTMLTRNLVISKITENPNIAFFYLKGNHDEGDSFDSLEELPSNLYMFSDSWKAYAFSDEGNVMIYGVELTSYNSRECQLNFSPDPSKVNIVMLHGQESEAKAGDRSEVIDLRNFRNKGINYLALGHVHEYKAAALDGGCRYCYPGCLEGRGFDETGEHGFVVLDIDEKNGSITDTFVPFAKRHLYEIPVDVSECLTTPEIISCVKIALSHSGARRDDLVKIVLSGKVSLDCEKDPEYVSRSFESDYFFVKVYDKTVIKVNPEDYKYDSSLKGEYVRCVLADDSLSDDEKGHIIKIGLNVLMGGEVL